MNSPLKRANSWITECEEFILSDWSPPDNLIQSERANSWITECEEYILPDWSPPHDPARVLAAEGRRNPSNHNDDMLMIMIMIIGNLTLDDQDNYDYGDCPLQPLPPFKGTLCIPLKQTHSLFGILEPSHSSFFLNFPNWRTKTPNPIMNAKSSVLLWGCYC